MSQQHSLGNRRTIPNEQLIFAPTAPRSVLTTGNVNVAHPQAGTMQSTDTRFITDTREMKQIMGQSPNYSQGGTHYERAPMSQVGETAPIVYSSSAGHGISSTPVYPPSLPSGMAGYVPGSTNSAPARVPLYRVGFGWNPAGSSLRDSGRGPLPKEALGLLLLVGAVGVVHYYGDNINSAVSRGYNVVAEKIGSYIPAISHYLPTWLTQGWVSHKEFDENKIAEGQAATSAVPQAAGSEQNVARTSQEAAGGKQQRAPETKFPMQKGLDRETTGSQQQTGVSQQQQQKLPQRTQPSGQMRPPTQGQPQSSQPQQGYQQQPLQIQPQNQPPLQTALSQMQQQRQPAQHPQQQQTQRQQPSQMQSQAQGQRPISGIGLAQSQQQPQAPHQQPQQRQLPPQKQQEQVPQAQIQQEYANMESDELPHAQDPHKETVQGAMLQPHVQHPAQADSKSMAFQNAQAQSAAGKPQQTARPSEQVTQPPGQRSGQQGQKASQMSSKPSTQPQQQRNQTQPGRDNAAGSAEGEPIMKPKVNAVPQKSAPIIPAVSSSKETRQPQIKLPDQLQVQPAEEVEPVPDTGSPLADRSDDGEGEDDVREKLHVEPSAASSDEIPALETPVLMKDQDTQTGSFTESDNSPRSETRKEIRLVDREDERKVGQQQAQVGAGGNGGASAGSGQNSGTSSQRRQR